VTTYTPSIYYRPDVDGLRAVAVIAVVLFHADLSFPGGYTGVDVFFVISGFLITRLIVRDLKEGRFSMLDFWERRARRILPALSVVVVFTLVVGYFLMLPLEYWRLARSALALVVFSSNILLFRENDYFSPAAEAKPLLHTWSLSLEEQFYLFIPFFLWALYRLGWANLVFWILAAGSLASFAVSAAGVYWFPWATFYLLPTRAWELAAGSMLAFARPVQSIRVREAMGAAGFLCVLAPFFLYSKVTPFPGIAALPPVVGTILIIWSGMRTVASEKRTMAARILEFGPLVWVGLLSYSLYLWHWPLLAFNHVLELWKNDVALKLGLIAASLGLAWLSWKFVEQPFRRGGLVRSRRMVFVASVTVGILISLASGWVIWRGLHLENRGPIVEGIMAVRVKCMADVSSTIVGKARRLGRGEIPGKLIRFGGRDDEPPQVFVWGDSYAEAALPALDAACRNLGLGGGAAICHGVVPTEVETNFIKKNLGRRFHNDIVLDYLRSDGARQSLRVVVLIARWSDQTRNPDFEARLAEISSTLRGCGYEVVLVDEVPRWTAGITKALGLQRAFGMDCPFETGVVRVVDGFEAGRLGSVYWKSDRLQALTRLLDPMPAFSGSDGKIRAYDGEGAFFWDMGHLSFHGALRLTPVFESLFPLLAPRRLE
jgi:peptidoglycan/LPS O-acetylase OafA/YrhL